MKNNNNVGLIVLGVLILISAIVFACSNRYKFYKINTEIVTRMDTWTGKATTENVSMENWVRP